ncbi:DUF488 family protein, N3 subclade [Mesorhizobium sp. A623]
MAPSPELRKWLGHDPAHWEEFGGLYSAEIFGHGDELDRLRDLAWKGVLAPLSAGASDLHSPADMLAMSVGLFQIGS